MMHIFINGLGASAGGGLTYLRNVLFDLALRKDVRATVALGAETSLDLDLPKNVEVICIPSKTGAARRFWFEQTQLPEMIRRCGADVLVSAGNFSLRKSPVPQILLSRNSLYTSPDFSRDLISRGELRMWLDTRLKAMLAKNSVSWANCTVAPSYAFAEELSKWSGSPVVAIHHGFDHERFFANQSPLSEDFRARLACAPGTVRIVLVSHYNYYRNFETVLRAIALMKRHSQFPRLRLFLTCELRKEKTSGAYNPQSAARLTEELDIHSQVVELGAVPYEQLHHLYKQCDLFVSAAYTETFAHPLVEAMASGVPVVASDLNVHREICGEAASYFPRFSPPQLAGRLAQLASDPEVRHSMGALGREQSLRYSWKTHVTEILALANELAGKEAVQRPRAAVSAA